MVDEVLARSFEQVGAEYDRYRPGNAVLDGEPQTAGLAEFDPPHLTDVFVHRLA